MILATALTIGLTLAVYLVRRDRPDRVDLGPEDQPDTYRVSKAWDGIGLSHGAEQ